MVISDVGDEDIIIIGYTFSTQNVSGVTFDNRRAHTYFVYGHGPWNLQREVVSAEEL